MHGCAPGSGGPTGSRNGAYKHGRFTKQTKELGRMLRQMARDADVLTATTMNRVGLKPLKPLRRKTHVKRALRAAKEKEAAK